jgi:hypothetical protein
MLHATPSTREAVIAALDGPRCTRELAEFLGKSPKAVESALARLVRLGTVACVTPDIRQARLYDLTVIGRAWRSASGSGQQIDASLRPDLHTYAWVQAGAYRRIVLKHLALDPRTPRQVRDGIKVAAPRMGMVHVWETLLTLADRGLAHRDGRVWTLTPEGSRVKAYALRSYSNGQ